MWKHITWDRPYVTWNSTWETDPEMPKEFVLRSDLSKLPLKLGYSWMIISHLHDDVIKWKHFPRNWPCVRGIPAQRSVRRSFDVFFKRLSKQSWGWWFETLSCPLWCHCNKYVYAINYPCPILTSSLTSTYIPPLKQKCRHFHEITGCAEICQNDNFRCSPSWQFHQNGDIYF